MMIRTERWKYIWRQQDIDELYDLNENPREHVNLLALKPTSEIESVKCALQARMLEWQAETGDVLAPPNNGDG